MAQSNSYLPSARQETTQRIEPAGLLREFDNSVEQLVFKVSPVVVQILVSGYGPEDTHGHQDTARIVRQHAIGGVIVDPHGCIMTNPHVVEGAYLHPIDQVMTVAVLRGQTQLSVTVPVMVHHENVDDLTDVPDLQRTFISELSMFVSDVNDTIKPLLHSDDVDSGVVFIAEAAGPNAVNTGADRSQKWLAHLPITQVVVALKSTFRNWVAPRG